MASKFQEPDKKLTDRQEVLPKSIPNIDNRPKPPFKPKYA